MADTWQTKRARIARLSKDLPREHPELQRLRTELRTQRTAEYIEKILAAWPPLTDEQRTKLAELLKPVRISANITGPRAEGGAVGA
jgi:hypothetical protein